MRVRRGVAVALAAVLSACAATETVPETGRPRPQLRYTERQMGELGAEIYREVLRGHTVVETGRDAERVREVGARLAAATGKTAAQGYAWEFALLDADDTVNAFCLPGGKVAVFSGILPICAGDQGLAVVLSHEIAHATLQHSNERMSESAAVGLIGLPVGIVTDVWGSVAPRSRRAIMDGLGLGALFGRALPWNQAHETEADEVGLRYLRAAGFDLDEAPRFWDRMQAASPPGQVTDSLSTHPASERRAAHLRRVIAEMKAEGGAAR